MPDNSSLGLSSRKWKRRPSSSPIDKEMVALYARHNEDSDQRKVLFPMIVGDEALKYPLCRAVQHGSFSSANLAWRSEENVVQQTMLEIRDDEVVKVMT